MHCTISRESKSRLIFDIKCIVTNENSVISILQFSLIYFVIFEAVYNPIMFFRKPKTAGSCISCSFFSFKTIVRMSGCFSTILSEPISCSPSLLLLGCGVVGVWRLGIGATDEVIVDVGVRRDDGVLGILDVDCLAGVVVALVDDTVELMLSELLFNCFLDIRPFFGLLLVDLVEFIWMPLVLVGVFSLIGTAVGIVFSDDCMRRLTCKFRRSFIVSVSI